MSRRYWHIRYPWEAAIDTGSTKAPAFYAALVGQALRYGRPASRRPGVLWALAARRGIPERAIAAAIRLLPSAPRPDLDHLLASLQSGWDDLQGSSTRLENAGPPSGMLALRRSAAHTAFVFDESGAPLVVAKSPIGPGGGVEREVRALEEAERACVAPRHLGRMGIWWLQEALPGVPLAPEPLELKGAPTLGWSKRHAALGAGLCRLAEATAKPGSPKSLADRVGAALEHPALSARTGAALAAAWRDVSRLRVSVLRHIDTSPQNCLFEEGRLVGIVDWEMAQPHGAPGFDMWNAAVAYMESSLGLVRWSDERALQAFASSWPDSGFWRGAREAARSSAAASGSPERMLDALEVVFFGTRVGDHIALPDLRRGTGIQTAIGMLEAVCSG